MRISSPFAATRVPMVDKQGCTPPLRSFGTVDKVVVVSRIIETASVVGVINVGNGLMAGAPLYRLFFLFYHTFSLGSSAEAQMRHAWGRESFKLLLWD